MGVGRFVGCLGRVWVVFEAFWEQRFGSTPVDPLGKIPSGLVGCFGRAFDHLLGGCGETCWMFGEGVDTF